MNHKKQILPGSKTGSHPKLPADHTDIRAVEEFVAAVYQGLFGDADAGFAAKAFAWMSDAFNGRHPNYSCIDCGYHDIEHTMQVTVCLTQLLAGRTEAEAQPALDRRVFELGVLAALFHDSGYLKRRDDTEGTGAKYTPVHVARSGDFAARLMLRDGYTPEDIEAVRNMIDCTAHGESPDRVPFRNSLERLVGYCVGTADLLAQMAASNYLEKLPLLYAEFDEARRHADGRVPASLAFEGVEDLVRRTPAFWQDYVLPRLQNAFLGVYRFLSPDGSDQSNPYLRQVLANMARIRDAERK
jgi:hypothetical protein